MQKIITKAYFNADIKPKIIELLQTAKSEVFVASAWFNDNELYDALLSLPRTVKVKVLIKKDEERNTLDWMNLGDCGIKVYQLIKESEGRSLMHNKFCVIDNETVITGSYNWTNGANYNNYENIVVINGNSELNFQFKEQFENLIQPIISFFDAKKQLLTENTNSHIGKVRAKTEIHIEEVKKVEEWMLDYMEKYNEMPPEQLTNQQFTQTDGNTSADDIGKGIVVYGSTLTTHGTSLSLSTSEEKKDWWDNKLSDDLKDFFNEKKFQINKKNKQYPGDEAINNLLELKSLYIEDISNVDGIEYLAKLTQLIINSHKISYLPDLSQLKSLTYLNISGSYGLRTLPNLKNLKLLESILITVTQINSLEDIPLLEGLTFLSCYDTPIITLNGIEKLPNLERLLCHQKHRLTLPNEKKRLENLGFSFQKEENTIDEKTYDTWIHEERINKKEANNQKNLKGLNTNNHRLYLRK
jgi:hypothetical protein